ncbi:MAG TPA: beta-L-arabinofuranosidase domain-containing protein [Terriglobia bacterium]|nr:beta-L-arabinofuranosidase domain-containing protein [Terriglobia bacterium]
MKYRRFLLLACGLAAIGGLASANDGGSPHYAVPPRFQWLVLGEVMPAGWIKAQMERNLREGAIGHLDQLAPEARSDIFGSGRNAPGRPNVAKEGFEQGTWWNGETEGNWHRGYIMAAYLTRDREAMRKSDAYVQHIFQTQDADGYIGVYSPELRYSRSHINGELWTQTCILRALLAYYELTGKTEVLHAVERAVKLTMGKYGPGKMTAFPNPHYPGDGISHGLMFVEVLGRLYELTGDVSYRDFGVWLYQDYCASSPATPDGSLVSLLDLEKPLVDHGPTTVEHLRVPLWAYFVNGNPDLGRAYENGLKKLARYLLPSGAVVSMEEIGGRRPDPTTTYYEFCTMKELLTTYCSALQKAGNSEFGDNIEKLMFNAVEGAGLAIGKGVTYCTRDNRYRVDGDLKGRDKFSPTHTDVAVCCNPNSAQITPLYVRGMWMRAGETGLAATLYGPSAVKTMVKGVKVQIEEKTDYPFSSAISFAISPEQPVDFPLTLRNPGWSKDTRVTCEGATVRREGSYFLLRKEWIKGDQVRLEFSETAVGTTAANGEIALQRGPLVYALAIPEIAKDVKDYDLPGFSDLEYFPAQGAHWSYALQTSAGNSDFGFTARIENDLNMLYPYDLAPIRLEGKLINLDTGQSENVGLVPMGSRLAILRRVTFPVAGH